MLTILVRWGYGLEGVITDYHINALGKLVLLGSVMLAYAYLFEAWGPIYGANVADRTEFASRIFGFTAPAYWGKVALNIVVPQALWFPAVRRSKPALFVISGGIIVGMWLERYIIVVSSLHRNYMPSYWGDYYPTVWDWAILAGSIGLFLTLFFALLRIVPIVAMSEVREIIAKDGAP